MKKVLFAAAALALSAAAAPAFAGGLGNAPAHQVSTAGVDFRDQAAVKAFYAQLRLAARDVCDSNSASPLVTQQDQLCVQKALANAVRVVDRPLLTALYDNNHYTQAAR